jgi:hypothetical protein
MTLTEALTEQQLTMGAEGICYIHKDVEMPGLEHGKGDCWCRPDVYTRDEVRRNLRSIKEPLLDS